MAIRVYDPCNCRKKLGKNAKLHLRLNFNAEINVKIHKITFKICKYFRSKFCFIFIVIQNVNFLKKGNSTQKHKGYVWSLISTSVRKSKLQIAQIATKRYWVLPSFHTLFTSSRHGENNTFRSLWPQSCGLLGHFVKYCFACKTICLPVRQMANPARQIVKKPE